MRIIGFANHFILTRVCLSIIFSRLHCKFVLYSPLLSLVQVNSVTQANMYLRKCTTDSHEIPWPTTRAFTRPISHICAIHFSWKNKGMPRVCKHFACSRLWRSVRFKKVPLTTNVEWSAGSPLLARKNSRDTFLNVFKLSAVTCVQLNFSISTYEFGRFHNNKLPIPTYFTRDMLRLTLNRTLFSVMKKVSRSQGMAMRVPNRFGGMRDLAFSAVICEIWSENRGGKRELQLRAGAGFRGVGMRESQREQSGIRDFKFLRDHINTESWQ